MLPGAFATSARSVRGRETCPCTHRPAARGHTSDARRRGVHVVTCSECHDGAREAVTKRPQGGHKKNGMGLRHAAYCRLLPPAAVLVFRRRCHRLRIHADLLPLFVLVLELHDSVDDGEERVVRGTAHIPAWMELGAALDHDDASRGHELTAVPLDAEVLGVRVATVAGGADALLMSHACLSRPSRRRS